MDILELREFCLAFAGSQEAMPFGDDTLVFKVGGKIFALTGIEPFVWINLKCEPLRAIELREQYREITAGFHMNKRHWNSVRVDGDLPDDFLKQMIEESYVLIYSALPIAIRETLNVKKP